MAHAPSHKHLELEITGLGLMADGTAELDGKAVYVPFTCPGDVINARVTRETKSEIRAQMQQLLTPSPDRQQPACQHFGTCGGCSLQHVSDTYYTQFKRRLLEPFIAGMGLDASLIAPMVQIKAQSRRRVDFKIATHNDRVLMGFMGKGSHHLIDLAQCPVSDSALTAILPDLRRCLAALKKPGRFLSLSLTALDDGLDAVFKLSSPIGDSDQETLIAFAKESPIIRLNVQVQPRRESRRVPVAEDPVCLYDEGTATITFAGVKVYLPSGAFLQATQAGQDAITSFVTTHLKGCQTIADLYSGCGTYSFALIAQSQRVSAYEGASEMAAAMNDACVAHKLEQRIATTVRDLFTDPLSAEELNHFDGIVINPPRNGALPQVTAISESAVRKVVMVSCDPATFKRDARQLLGAGYRLTLAVPIDQFYWSRHLELVAVFEKA